MSTKIICDVCEKEIKLEKGEGKLTDIITELYLELSIKDIEDICTECHNKFAKQFRTMIQNINEDGNLGI